MNTYQTMNAYQNDVRINSLNFLSGDCTMNKSIPTIIDTVKSIYLYLLIEYLIIYFI